MVNSRQWQGHKNFVKINVFGECLSFSLREGLLFLLMTQILVVCGGADFPTGDEAETGVLPSPGCQRRFCCRTGEVRLRSA